MTAIPKLRRLCVDVIIRSTDPHTLLTVFELLPVDEVREILSDFCPSDIRFLELVLSHERNAYEWIKTLTKETWDKFIATSRPDDYWRYYCRGTMSKCSEYWTRQVYLSLFDDYPDQPDPVQDVLAVSHDILDCLFIRSNSKYLEGVPQTLFELARLRCLSIDPKLISECQDFLAQCPSLEWLAITTVDDRQAQKVHTILKQRDADMLKPVILFLGNLPEKCEKSVAKIVQSELLRGFLVAEGSYSVNFLLIACSTPGLQYIETSSMYRADLDTTACQQMTFPDLKHLCMQFVGFTDTRTFAQKAFSPTLTSIDLSGSQFETMEYFCEAIRSAPALKFISFESCEFTEQYSRALLAAVSNSPAVEVLNLGGQNFTTDEMIATFLRDCKTIRELDLSNTHERLGYTYELLHAIQQHQTLEQLHLEKNNIDDRQAVALVQAVVQCARHEKFVLNLRLNNITSQGVVDIRDTLCGLPTLEEASSSKRMQELNLSGNTHSAAFPNNVMTRLQESIGIVFHDDKIAQDYKEVPFFKTVG